MTLSALKSFVSSGRGYPWVLVHFSRVHARDLERLLEEAWRLSAGKRFVAKRAPQR